MCAKIGETLIAYRGEDPIELKVVAVNDEMNAILYEDSSIIQMDGCDPFQVEFFFPDFQYDHYKQYYIMINDVLYDGKALEYGFVCNIRTMHHVCCRNFFYENQKIILWCQRC